MMEHRRCTTCGLAGRTTPSTFVVENADGLQWFECGGHVPSDHPDGPWVRRVELHKWLQVVQLHHLGLHDAQAVMQLRGKFRRALQALSKENDHGEQEDRSK